MNEFNTQKAINAGKLAFMVAKDGQIRYTMGTSLTQMEKRYKGWNVFQITTEEYLNNKK